MRKRSRMSSADTVRSFLVTALFVQLCLDLARWFFPTPVVPGVLCAQWVELIAAVIAAATTIISAAASAEDVEDAEEAAQEAWRLQQRDKDKQRRIELKRERQTATARELDLRHNDRVIEENEKARQREREETQKAVMKAHGESIAGILSPREEAESLREHRAEAWGV